MEQTELSGFSETVEFTKTQPIEVIQAVQVLGQRLSGELLFPRWAVNRLAEDGGVVLSVPKKNYRTIKVTVNGCSAEMTIPCRKKKGLPPHLR